MHSKQPRATDGACRPAEKQVGCRAQTQTGHRCCASACLSSQFCHLAESYRTMEETDLPSSYHQGTWALLPFYLKIIFPLHSPPGPQFLFLSQDRLIKPSGLWTSRCESTLEVLPAGPPFWIRTPSHGPSNQQSNHLHSPLQA